LAIPFFILAGVIMEHSGISRKLIDLADKLVGHYKSGIVFITAIVAIFFAAISGSGPATVAAIGGILIPALVKNGYNKESAAGLIASSGSIGIIIPPSIAFIVFAVVAGEQIPVSIGRLFIAGIVPGILIGLGLVAAALFVRWRSDRKTMEEATNETQSNFKQVKEKRASFSEIMSAFFDALWGSHSSNYFRWYLWRLFYTDRSSSSCCVLWSICWFCYLSNHKYQKAVYHIC